MDFDRRQRDRHQRISNGDAGVGVRGRIDNDRVELAARMLNPRHQLAFDVRLEALDGGAGAPRARCELAIDFCERGAAVVLRLAFTEQVQIGPMQDQDARLAGARHFMSWLTAPPPSWARPLGADSALCRNCRWA